jgi:hypothetical protein
LSVRIIQLKFRYTFDDLNQEGVRLEAGGWGLGAGGWRLEAGGWRLEAGGWTIEIEIEIGIEKK